MVCGRGSGRSQLKSVSGTDRVRLCGHVKLSLLNSADYPEYPDRKVGVRACATSSASCGLRPCQSFHSKVRAKFIKKKIRKKRRKKIRKKIQEDTFNDPVSTPYGKANSSLRPDSFLKSLVIPKIFALAALVQKFVRMTSDFKKLFTGPGKNYIIPTTSYTSARYHQQRHRRNKELQEEIQSVAEEVITLRDNQRVHCTAQVCSPTSKANFFLEQLPFI